LPRVLRFFDISVLASASMGPAFSLASTMGPMIAAAGAAAPLSLLALCAIMLCVAVAFAQLSRVAPSAGSSYSWIRLAFGDRAGAYGAWLLLLSNFFATMATAVPAGIYTLALLAPAHEQDPLWAAIVGAVWILGSAALLYAGIRPTALVTAIALALELGVLVASAFAAWLMPHAHAVASATPASAHGVGSLIPLTFFGFVNAMTLAIWMSDGWEVSASAGEEVAGDRRASGRGGITGLVATAAILLFCMTGYMHLGTPRGFADNQADSLAYVGDLLGSGAWRFAIVATVLISCCSSLWTTILYLSRSVYAMGRDGLLPAALGRLDRRAEPLWSLASIAILVTVCELATGFSASAADQLALVLNVSSVFLGLLFVFSAAACARRFWNEPGVTLAGVLVPGFGALALLAVLAATIRFEDPRLQWYAWGGMLLGIPFALWRGRAVKQR
jgi:amino acid transporter